MGMKGSRLVMSVGCEVRMLLMVEKVGLGLLRMLSGLYPFRSVISVPSPFCAQPVSDRVTARNTSLAALTPGLAAGHTKGQTYSLDHPPPLSIKYLSSLNPPLPSPDNPL